MLFLLFTAFDLALPQLCDAETKVTLAADASVSPLAAPAKHDAGGSEPAPPEDCFCCCAHVIAAPTFVFETTPVQSLLPHQSATQSPSAVAHLIDLPPRLA